LSETEIKDENILGNFQEAIQRVGISEQEQSRIGIEYACLCSMMLEPRNTTMWNALALVYMISDRMEAAEEAIERSLDIDTSNAWTWSIWGDIFLQEGKLVEAERAYRMALELDPNDYCALRHLAKLYYRRAAFPEAIDFLQILLSLRPNDQDMWDVYTHCLRSLGE
jgi:tetratricopeptide (TPR) repeat protein